MKYYKLFNRCRKHHLNTNGTDNNSINDENNSNNDYQEEVNQEINLTPETNQLNLPFALPNSIIHSNQEIFNSFLDGALLIQETTDKVY